MKLKLILVICTGTLALASCTSAKPSAEVDQHSMQPRMPSGTASSPVTVDYSNWPSDTKNNMPWAATDPSLKREGGLTVWTLQAMAANNQLGDLNELFFNRGVSLDSLPVGYSAGAGAKVFGLPQGLAFDPLEQILANLTGQNWKGKVFFGKQYGFDPNDTSGVYTRVGHGLNRIKLTPLGGPITPMASFVTKLVDSDPVITKLFKQDHTYKGVRSNFVILNYAHPTTKGYYAETILVGSEIGLPVYDVMVAVPGAYGPVYIGKTWKGTYDQYDTFTANDVSKQIAWYFLDFNQGALNAQRRDHWGTEAWDVPKYVQP